MLAGLGFLLAAVSPASAQTPAPSPTPAPTPAPKSFPAVVTLSAAGGRVAALRETSDGRLELLIGDGAELKLAPGVAPLDGSRVDFPRVHVGTDGAGRTVVTYPRCKTSGEAADLRTNCDLRIYDVESGKDRLLPGVRRPGRNEYEAVMDRGALLYSASGSSQVTSGLGRGLWYRPFGGRERRIALNPGRELALRGDRIAQVISDGSKAGEEPCENSTLVLRSTRGAARLLARDCVYPYGNADAWATPSFVGNGLYWSRIVGTTPNLFRLDLRTRAIREARVKANIFGFQATGPAAGLALVLTAGTVLPGSDFAAANAVAPIDSITWSVRKKTLIKDVVAVDDNPLA